MTCLWAKEGILAVSEDRHAGLEGVFPVKLNRGSVITRAVRENLQCLRSLPEYIALVFQIQFFAWLGWFPSHLLPDIVSTTQTSVTARYILFLPQIPATSPTFISL